MLDRDLMHAARGMALEAAGVALGDQALAERGRLVQFSHLRRRQVRVTRESLAGRARRPRRLRRSPRSARPAQAPGSQVPSPAHLSQAAARMPQAVVRVPWSLAAVAARPPVAAAGALLAGVRAIAGELSADDKGVDAVS
ncbi:MAG: hypothetical protein E6Q90_01165 [Actinobacteria bacterium]|nr:MAG: hypothetical protein E6Q90_01165 [Actinomycetota bacterium]